MATPPAAGSARADNGHSAGLTEPENYFSESAELIIAKTSFGSVSTELSTGAEDDNDHSAGLIVPANYFETLSGTIESQIALENVLPPLDSTQDEKAIPAGYFGEMERELHVHIALDNVKQDEGFVVPEGYFEKFSDKIVAEASASLHEDTLSDDPNVPEGYFVHLADKVVARIENEQGEERGKIIVLSTWKKYVRPTALAASVALLIGFGWILLANRDNGNGDLVLANNFFRITPGQVNPGIPPVVPSIDTTNAFTNENQDAVVRNTNPKNHNEIKPPVRNAVIMNDDEILAQTDLMDESMVMDFVAESNVIVGTEEVLDADMMEYLMNDNSGLDVFDPSDRP